MKITVTQEHIDKAREWKFQANRKGSTSCNCPIAKALTDELKTPCEWGFVSGRILHTGKIIVAKVIYFEITKTFVDSFDFCNTAQPFTFEIED